MKMEVTGVLGDHSPQALLNTIFYMNGLYFAVRNGKEHHQLRHSLYQICIEEREGKTPSLLYTKGLSKNNQGGLKGRKSVPKAVKHYANMQDPARCFFHYFNMYNSLCPSPDAFCLKPLTVVKDSCWFTPVAVGHTKNIIQSMCKQAGIIGFKMNHSLQATVATQLYKEGVDKQLIMERTGIAGLGNYKRTTTEQN